MRRIQISQHLSRMRMGVSDLIESGVDLGNVIRRNRKHGDFPLRCVAVPTIVLESQKVKFWE